MVLMVTAVTPVFRFEVIGPTILGDGVELSGVEVPLTIYMPIADLPRFFVQLESRR